ncbi:NlpC/P60 family protein [Streptomyces carpinensis]|uniref:C40 family peptidase n=1 Tax=Streptomyces carpinensis TaxID=66369 RepID=UPI001FC9C987|nr:NlpC/P60 family protein [Streptomyces carpinensis]
MAPERTSPSGGISLPDPRGSPGSSTAPGDGGPSRAEVQRRVSSLYDRAETATGNYNATRAMSRGRRTRVNPAPRNASGASAPALDAVAREWFDATRARLGPSVPAALPPGRMPRPGSAGSLGSGAERRPVDGSDGLGDSGRPARSSALSGGGRRDAASPLRELTAGPTGAPTARQFSEPPATFPAPATAGDARELPAWPASEPTVAPGAGSEVSGTRSGLVARSPEPALRSARDQLHRKLSAARDLLSRGAALATPRATFAARPAEEPWPTASEQRWLTAAPESASTAFWLTSEPDSTRRQPPSPPVPGLPAPWETAGRHDSPAPLIPPAAPNPQPTVATNQALATPDPGPGDASPYGRQVARVLDFARAQIGKPCVWGATGPGSYDCSSLAQAAWRVAGVALPRTALEQAACGTAIHPAELRPGDLVFFYGDAGHVGLCTGNGTMVHAPGPGASIREESIFFAGPRAVHSAIRPA